MRRRLILVFVAISSLVAVAFVVPLGFLVQQTAEDRAIDAARADAAAIVPTLIAAANKAEVEAAMATTSSGEEQRMSILTSQGWPIGDNLDSVRVQTALASGQSSIGDVDGGKEVVAVVASGPAELSAIRVFVPNSQLRKGQWRAWAVLAAVGLALVGISVLVADRLSRTIVRPTENLAKAARRLGDGDLTASVEPDGPEELVELAGAFNALGAQVGSMLERERELVAELSHRLRTPLTQLRMRLDQVEDPTLASELGGDLDSVTGVVNGLIAEARSSLEANVGCNADQVVTDRADFWAVLADDQERPFRFERGFGPLPVSVSEAELAAAVDVLLENVFAHTNDGAALTVGFGSQKGQVRIWVEDGGDGLRMEEARRGTSSGGSTGLGLDIARRTASNAGGGLQIGTSALGGASVVMSFPMADRQS